MSVKRSLACSWVVLFTSVYKRSLACSWVVLFASADKHYNTSGHLVPGYINLYLITIIFSHINHLRGNHLIVWIETVRLCIGRTKKNHYLQYRYFIPIWHPLWPLHRIIIFHWLISEKNVLDTTGIFKLDTTGTFQL